MTNDKVHVWNKTTFNWKKYFSVAGNKMFSVSSLFLENIAWLINFCKILLII